MVRHDIGIVGMGPVGSAAGVLFAHAGLDVITFERDQEVYPLPRAVAMDGEIVRAFQRIDLGEAITRLLQEVRPGDRAGFANSRREWLFGQDMSSFGVNGWPPISMFDQPEVETWLRTTATTQPEVTACIGAEVQNFEDKGDHVLVRTSAPGGQTSATEVRYLLGCDGAASGVRRTLGIGWHDLGYDHNWLVVDVVVKDGHQLTNETVQVCDPDRLATYIATKDPFRRWEFKLNDGETREEMLRPEAIRKLLDPWTPRDTYDVRRAAVYQFHAATADTWRVGRVLLAGDAAHQTPPFLGQGMNAGMRDVINLAWKFPLVLAGVADEALLNSYQAERAPHASDLVDWAVAIGKLMEHLAAVEAAERHGGVPPVLPPDSQAAGYGQGRETPPLRAGVILPATGGDDSTGHLFSQPVVRDENGRRFRLDERLGDGFAVIARTKADLEMTESSRRIVRKLDIVTTTLEGLQEDRGHFDRLFGTSAAAVVRPDRYVFGHTTESLSLDDLLAQLAEKLLIQG